MKKSILSKTEEPNEDQQNVSIRPLCFKDFVGQETLKQNLEVFIKASKSRNDTIDHILFYGPPGLGKTTLARIVANEIGSNFKSTSGPVLAKSGDLAAILTNLEKGDILFIDEIHRLNITIEEILYSAMEDFSIDIIIGEGPSARTVKIDIPPFTLIGATTRFGLLSTPLRTRFGILSHLEFYTPAELVVAIKRAASVLKTEITDDAAIEIANRSRGTARIALRLLRRVRDFAYAINENNLIDRKIACTALECLKIDPIGLDVSDKTYLSFIAENYNGGPVGIETISAGLSEERDSIEDTIEPYLIQIGFIAKTSRGRVLTKKALQHIDFNLQIFEESENLVE